MVEENNVESKSLLEDRYSFFRTIASDFVKFSIIAYGLGFLIVNSSLLEYGYMSFDITTTRYLISGLLFLLLCSITLLASNICRRQALNGDRFFIYTMAMFVQVSTFNLLLGLNYTRKNIIYYPSWLFNILYIIIFTIPFFSFFIIARYKNKKIRKGIEVSIILILIVFYILYGSKEICYLGIFMILIFAYEETILLKPALLKKEFDINDLNTPRSIIIKIIGLMSLPILFGTQIYTKIDRMRGGGAPLSASIIMKEEIEEEIKKNEKEYIIDFDRVNIILENGDSVIIGLDNGGGKKAALEIPKRNIVSIKYNKRKRI